MHEDFFPRKRLFWLTERAQIFLSAVHGFIIWGERGGEICAGYFCQNYPSPLETQMPHHR